VPTSTIRPLESAERTANASRGTSGRSCAYCGEAGRLTRADIFSTFLQAYYPSYRTHLDHLRSRRARNAPVVRDVCQRCNNEILGSLDACMARVNDAYLSLPPPPSGVTFRYDYHTLLRYLLKVWYNSARASGERIAEHARLAPYILGRENEPPLATTVCLALLGDFALPAAENGQAPARQTPDVFRLGNIIPEDAEWRERTEFARPASFNSYLFTAYFWKDDVSRSRRREFARGLAARWNLTVLLPNRSIATVPISGIDTSQSLRTSFTGGTGVLHEFPRGSA
jgi:hypothetical protein